MGQKINATGLRIGVNKNWKSVWYADDKKYADLLHQDVKVRKYIRKKLKPAGVHRIKIKRSLNKVIVEIMVARPGVVIGRGGAGIEELKAHLEKMFKVKADVKIMEVKNPDVSAMIIAQNVAMQVSRRIVPKHAMSRELEKAKATRLAKGIRIWVSGRIKGTEIARTEKVQWGSIPLQTLRADIDFAKVTTAVPNAGLHGVKVWVYRGEKRDYNVEG